jgi:hypothetical protein
MRHCPAAHLRLCAGAVPNSVHSASPCAREGGEPRGSEPWTGPLLAQMQEQMRQVADRLMDDFFRLAGLVALVPGSPEEVSEQDLDEGTGPATELRATALCVMTDYLQPAITGLLGATRLPDPASPSGAEILRRMCEVLGKPGASGGKEEE